ncbi:MAG: carboxypeptidase regulatory-like domain-containing protein [Chitinophagaceae bacterium]|nr:carboxypeptidase regulatory-like domain-containing protein [Chitinophagaceae bacterium]MCW5929524.1 carboxypeptidase regulatory-like domain-containing protein [Chitinophagaceae bacterium]
MHRFCKIMFVMLMAGMHYATAWSQVNVSITLKPPYSSSISDYYHLENKAVIVITNSSSAALNIKLGGSIVNESRGVYVRTNPDWQPPAPISLAPFATTTIIANPDAMRFLDQSNATTNANSDMLATIVRTGRLPEGAYSICVDAYDYYTGRLLSARGANCFHFELSWLDPPVITFPQNDYIYPAEQISKNFSWTPPLGNLAGGIVEYDQVVVKVQPGQNPNDAIAAARDFNAGNPVLVKRNMLTQTYITQPYDLNFENGATYAMQVVARDRNNKLVLKNEGRSEIVVFQVGKSGIAQNQVPEYVAETPLFTTVQLKAKLRYYWMKNGSASNKNNFGNTVSAPGDNEGGWSANNSGTDLQSANNSNWSAQNADGPVRHNTYGFSGYQNSPLASVTVQLIQAIQFSNPSGSGLNQLSGLPGNIWMPGSSVQTTGGTTISLSILATATSSAGGELTFNVPNLDNIDFGWKQGSFGGSGGEHAWTLSGQYRKVLMLKITSPGESYYADPVQFISGVPGNKEMGTFYCRVKTFNPTVLVADRYDRALTYNNIEVLLVRTNARPHLAPKDEGDPGNFANPQSYNAGMGTNYEIVAKGTTNSSGQVSFRNILVSGMTSGGSPYYLFMRPKNENTTSHSLNYNARELRYATASQWFNDCYYFNGDRLREECYYETSMTALQAVNNGRFSIAGQDPAFDNYTILSTTRTLPRVYGQVKNAAAGNDGGMAQNEENAYWVLWKISREAAVKAKNAAYQGKWGSLMESNQAGFDFIHGILQNNGTPPQIQRYGTTGADGMIDARGLPIEGDQYNPKGYFYILQASKYGFKPAFFAVNRDASGNNNTTGDMHPAALGMAYNAGHLSLEPKGKVKVKLVNQDGQRVSGQVYYTDPATGQTGTVVTVSTSGGYPTVYIPSGSNRKLVVLPTNTEKYEQDTITLNVPADETITEEITVQYKLHRIYFNVRNSAGQPLANVKISLIDIPADLVTMYPDVRSPYSSEAMYFQAPGNDQNNNNNYVAVNNNTMPQVLGPMDRMTNNNGGADFAFTNSSPSFKFRITGPPGTSYVVMHKNVHSTASKTWQRVDIELKSGRTVKGMVKLGTSPVAGARVRVKGSNPLIETLTNAQGEYELRGVPRDTLLTFSATKPYSGYVGMEYKEGQVLMDIYGNVNYANQITTTDHTTFINFKLRIYDGLDLSRLLGFPLEVSNLVETNNGSGSVSISGLVSVTDSLNNLFKMYGTAADGKVLSTIDFSDIVVVADSKKNEAQIPYCRPRTLPVRTDINEQPVLMYDSYTALLWDNVNGITLSNYGAGNQAQGAALGKVQISASSVNDNNFGYLPGQELFLKRSVNDNSLQFPVFTSSGTAAISGTAGFPVVNSNGTNFRYALKFNQAEFTVIASSATSRLYKDSIVLDSRLQTNLSDVNPSNLNFPIGHVVVNEQRKLNHINAVVNSTVPPDAFSMQIKRVKVDNSGVHFDGTINPIGLSLPFTEATLYPDRFHIAQGSLDVNNLKLLDAIPVQVHTGATFGYDATRATPAWYLSITANGNNNPAATISGQYMNGLPAQSSIPFSSLWFYSNGDRELNLGNITSSYRLHNVTDFSLQSVELSDNMIALNGLLNMGIPAIPAYNTGLLYDKAANNTISNLTLRPFSMSDQAVNGIVLSFNGGNSNSIQFSNGKLEIKGILRDENPDVFKNVRYTITKTNALTQLTLDTLPNRQQIILGGDNNSRMVLSNIDGKMWVENNAWNHLYFNGDMPEDMGFTADGRRMRFEVKGRLEVVNQRMHLKSVSTPFGDLNMTYDLAKHRLIGQLSFDKTIGTMDVRGDAELVVDKLGYYFMGAGAMEMSNPTVTGGTFMLFGDYKHKQSDRRAAIESMLKEYSYYYAQLHELPNGYSNINALNGFFFEAGGQIPFPGLPNVDINLGLVYATLSVTVGGDIRMGMNFGEVNSYNLGMGVFVNALFAMGHTGGIVCGGVELRASAGIDMDGTYYSNGDYTMQVTGYITASGSVYAGWGLLCTAECTLACDRSDASGSVGIRAIGTVTNNGSSFRLEFDANTFPRD